tara:strand:- start:1127 stop:1546 length:420 start_codon:yes stop_codon:yes gene_type:complete
LKISRTYLSLIALISFDLSAISLKEFYIDNDSNPILPIGTSNTTGSSITVIYDLDGENRSGGKINLEVKEEFNQILESEETITISLKPGTYSLSAWNTSNKSERKAKSIQLKDGDHQIWAVKVLNSHKEPPKQDVIITL